MARHNYPQMLRNTSAIWKYERCEQFSQFHKSCLMIQVAAEADNLAIHKAENSTEPESSSVYYQIIVDCYYLMR
jgi:hypothetical protein